MRPGFKTMRAFAEGCPFVKSRMLELARTSWRELLHVQNGQLFSVCYARAYREYHIELYEMSFRKESSVSNSTQKYFL